LALVHPVLALRSSFSRIVSRAVAALLRTPSCWTISSRRACPSCCSAAGTGLGVVDARGCACSTLVALAVGWIGALFGARLDADGAPHLDSYLLIGTTLALPILL